MEFGERIKSLRESRGIIQEDFASYLGVSRPTISGYETKGYQPSHEKLQRMSELFNVTIDYLINGGPLDRELEFQQKYSKQQANAILSTKFSALSLSNKVKVIDYVDYLLYEETRNK